MAILLAARVRVASAVGEDAPSSASGGSSTANPFDSLALSADEQPRLAPKTRADLASSPGHLAAFDSIVASKRGVGVMTNGGLPGPFNAWFYMPAEVAEAHAALGNAQRFAGTSLDKKLKEVAILLTGVHFRQSVEVWAHARVAKKAGVADGVIESIAALDPAPPFEQLHGEDMGGRMRLVHEFTAELLQSNRVSDAAYAAAKGAVGGTDEAMVELVQSIAHYSGLAMAMNAFRVPAPGSTQPFPYNAPSSSSPSLFSRGGDNDAAAGNSKATGRSGQSDEL